MCDDGRGAAACADNLTVEAYQIKGRAELITEGEACEHYRKLAEECVKSLL